MLMNTDKTILMVEDNPDILWINSSMFAAQGYTVITAENLKEARRHMDKCLPDIIILDILLPDGSGLDFIPEIRAKTNAPILMLTSLTDRDDRLLGLRAGGDDYIAKPYDIDELSARVSAFLRREEMHQANPVHEIVRGPLVLDTVSGQAFLNDEDMLLTPKEFGLLLLLARNEGKALAKETLFRSVWKQAVNDDARTVKAHISNVRKKLSGSGYTISVSRGEGYCFARLGAD
jgi:DNA-binding response OmpR family regulator